MSTPSSTLNKLFDSTTTTTTTTSSPSNNLFQTNMFRTSKSTDSIDTDCTNQATGDAVDTVDASTQRSSRLLSFQWSNVFNSRNSKSTSQLNLVNCDNNCNTNKNAESVPKTYANPPHDQLTKGSIYRNLFTYVFPFIFDRIQVIFNSN